MIQIQLSSGQGPAECELAVGKLLAALREEYPGIALLQTAPGSNAGGYRSVLLEGDDRLACLEGTVKWVCQSPYRPRHKRKNWFVDVSVCGQPAQPLHCGQGLVRFETFRSGGKGGQNVNKVETGVRAIHLPTGLTAASTTARSQHQNRQLALERLCALLAEQNAKGQAALREMNRLEHYRLERGKPVRIYEGPAFQRVL